MRQAGLLDCTLRDGAYLLDKTFGNENTRGIIHGLRDAEIDFIEIGFLQDEGFGEGKTVYKNSADAAKFVPEDKRQSKFAVLADCSRYTVSNLDNRSPDSIDAVRECFFKHEIRQAMENCRAIKEKGYLLFVQPVDILGYSDKELLDLIEQINSIEPYCISIVDTFGSMYQEDLHRIFELLHHNLVQECRIGFHSHNNMQLSNALSQEFLRMTSGKREAIVDGTLSGMGRGAGNTPTELIAQYMVSKMQARYDMDVILDIIDNYMDNIKAKCSWGYDTAYFVAGCYSAHVNNIAFLKEKNSIRSKDIRYILNKIGVQARKRYDYGLLEETYLEYLDSDMDDSLSLERLSKVVKNRAVLILLPGSSVKRSQDKILKFIGESKPVIIAVNFIPDNIKMDFIYMNNLKRYSFWKENDNFRECMKIVTSNLPIDEDEQTIKVSFTKHVKCGWEYMDNSAIMLLRLLDRVEPASINMAGFDGYEKHYQQNYYSDIFERSVSSENAHELNKEIGEMLLDYLHTRKNKNVPIEFLTSSRFEVMLDKESRFEG